MTLKKKGHESILGKEENAFCTVTYPWSFGHEL